MKTSVNCLGLPSLPNKGCQCIGKIILLNMYEVYSNGTCLVPPPIMGHLQDQNRNRLQLSGCGQRLHDYC